MSKPRWCWWYACAVLYLWFFAHFALQAWQHPVKNWDMIAYMGVVQSYSDDDPNVLYDDTMARVENAVDPMRFAEITLGNRLSSGAEAFYQQLPFYKVKPLYTGAMWLFSHLGMTQAEASYALSILGFVATGALCFFMIPRGMDAGVWWLAVMWFCASGHWPYNYLPAWSTPDTLYTFFFLAALGMWLYRKSAMGLGIFLLLAQLTRPDMILFTPLLLAFFALDKAESRLPVKTAWIIFGANLFAYFVVTQIGGHYGYLVQFYYTFINKSPHPAEIVPDIGVARFFAIVWAGTLHMLHGGRLQAMAALSLVAGAGYWRNRLPEQAWLARLLAVTWLALAARFFLYPAWWEDRYYYPYWFTILYASAEILWPYAEVALTRLQRSFIAVYGKG